MKPLLLLLAAGCLLTAPAAVAQTTAPPAATLAPATTLTAAQRRAAETLLTTMQADKMLADAINQTLAIQLQQNPQLQAVEPEMRAFFSKYMGWTAIKEDLVQLYAHEFTPAELADINRFYQSPTGQKFVSKQTTLMQQSMLVGQRRVQEHLPELKAAVDAKLKAAPDQ